jgi:hypothetical protein
MSNCVDIGDYTMAEDKKTSWAPDMVPNAEELEQKKWEAERQHALDNAMITIASALVELVNEQKRINDYLIGGGTTSKSPFNLEPEKKTAPTPETKSVLDEGAIIQFYRDKLSDVLGNDEIAKTEIRVQEKNVYVKLPWLGREKFGPVGGLMRDLGAEYISDGKNTHYLAPIP